MRFIQQLLAGVSLAFAATALSASPAKPVEGADYITLPNPQQTEPGNRVEVIEFFGYFCPHCNALEPALNDWVKRQGNNIVFKRVPVIFRDSNIPQQKLYYTLEAMGKVDELHGKVFHAIHNGAGRNSLDSDKKIADFIEAQGVNRKAFLDVYNSFGVQAKIQQVKKMQEVYNIRGVPTLIIDGRYQTSPTLLQASMGNQPVSVLHAATLQVMDHLVAKTASGKKN